METRAFYYLASEGTHLSVTLCQTILTFLQRSHKVQNDICSNGRPYIFTFVSPPKNDSFRKDSCFSPDVFFFLQREISEMCGPTGVKFCKMVSTRRCFIMLIQNFGGRTPKKFQGPKTCKIRPNFGRLGSSAANISETDEDIQNRIVIPCMAIPPALGETSTVKFGPVTLEI